MKIYLVCMANETTVEIIRGYTGEAMARKVIESHPSNDTVKWGYATLDLVTAEELREAEK